MEIIKKGKKLFAKLKNGKELEMSEKHANMTKCGKEVLDPKPIEVPLRIKKLLENSVSPQEQLKRMLAQEKMQKSLEGFETENEFFDVDIIEDNLKSSHEFNSELHDQLMAEKESKFQEEFVKDDSLQAEGSESLKAEGEEKIEEVKNEQESSN